MKNSFIPVNSLEKGVAFCNSLDVEHLKRTQLINPKEDYIPTLDIIKKLGEQGWSVKGVCEQRKSNRKVGSHYVKLFNPDFALKENGKIEAESNLIISNSTDGKGALHIDLGLFRQVCSNGLVRRDSVICSNIKHNKDGQRKLVIALDKINNLTESNIKKFETYKLKLLSKEEMQELARQALRIRFREEEKIDFNQLLKVNRKEDRGDNLWLVYNRIQENLTQSDMLINAKGELISGTGTMKSDLYVNNQLIELVEKFI